VGQISTIFAFIPANSQTLTGRRRAGNPFTANPEPRRVSPTAADRLGRKILLSLPHVIGSADRNFQPGNPNVIFALPCGSGSASPTILSGAERGGDLQIETARRETPEQLTAGFPPHELFGPQVTSRFELEAESIRLSKSLSGVRASYRPKDSGGINCR